ncbi:MAG: hypothetical protein R3B13_08275 [Polyangiaceae bacterium]
MRATVLHVATLALLGTHCAPAANRDPVDPVPTVSAPPASASTQAADSAAEPSAPPPPITPAGIGPGPGLGRYSSASCGARNYERVIELSAGGRVQLVDKVAPCPPGAACVWSGIVMRQGSWSLEGGAELGKPFRVLLSFDGANDPKARPVPDHLLWWESRGELSEPDESCGYRKLP